MTDNPANCERVKTPLKHTPTKEVVSDDLGYGKERRVSFVTPFGGYHKAMEKHLCLRLCQARIWLKRRGGTGVVVTLSNPLLPSSATLNRWGVKWLS